jgi:hypothetical protein
MTQQMLVEAGIPFLPLNYQAKCRGLTGKKVIKRTLSRSEDGDQARAGAHGNTVGKKLNFPVAHIQAVDPDNDQLLEWILKHHCPPGASR